MANQIDFSQRREVKFEGCKKLEQFVDLMDSSLWCFSPSDFEEEETQTQENDLTVSTMDSNSDE